MTINKSHARKIANRNQSITSKFLVNLMHLMWPFELYRLIARTDPSALNGSKRTICSHWNSLFFSFVFALRSFHEFVESLWIYSSTSCEVRIQRPISVATCSAFRLFCLFNQWQPCTCTAKSINGTADHASDATIKLLWSVFDGWRCERIENKFWKWKQQIKWMMDDAFGAWTVDDVVKLSNRVSAAVRASFFLLIPF